MAARLAWEGEPPDWVREYDRFDTDYGATAAAGDPIEYWLRNPTLYFEPPHLAAHRMWRGIVEVGRAGPEQLLVLVATHSAPMRAFVAAACGSDPGEPRHLEDVRVRVRPGRHGDRHLPGHTGSRPGSRRTCPPWIDKAWFESFGR